MAGRPAGNDMKPAGKIKTKPKAGRLDALWKKLAALPRRIWAVGGAVCLVIVIAWFMLVPAQREAPQTPSPSGAAGTEGTPNRKPLTSTALPDTKMPEKQLAFIQSIRLQPSLPTRMDSLKAEIDVSPDAPGQLVYTYRWEVNDHVIEEATGDTLNLSTFKKRDLINVTVTPHDGSTAGSAVESPTVAIHSIPPSLELKAMNQARKIGELIELQLVGDALDGGELTFSLEAPYVPGMTIDNSTGKISWLLQPGQKGSLRFGAAVQDDNRTKVTKVFDIIVE